MVLGLWFFDYMQSKIKFVNHREKPEFFRKESCERIAAKSGGVSNDVQTPRSPSLSGNDFNRRRESLKRFRTSATGSPSTKYPVAASPTA